MKKQTENQETLFMLNHKPAIKVNKNGLLFNYKAVKKLNLLYNYNGENHPRFSFAYLEPHLYLVPNNINGFKPIIKTLTVTFPYNTLAQSLNRLYPNYNLILKIGPLKQGKYLLKPITL